ncbi:hypothetical protein DIJ64_02665 [Mycobacterium leprae]|uniref:Uncharacterized protein n=1 Tax=Mycobacterium leprae TaxID=1769 RepID=A0AAD0P4J1_MYCLR|nr:hypothetical protein [Mycobacterium leprae]AWV47390.1 hypothetical protein DIJ64_02665 [Mycobacterium leprae]OAR20237.1 hypothetical protein A8144_03045 [Mycobacterium leprae 3125609]OAX71166.1 hypothetical protein A3216_07430 [Mycobacterium leprae 7935681]
MRVPHFESRYVLMPGIINTLVGVRHAAVNLSPYGTLLGRDLSLIADEVQQVSASLAVADAELH